MQNIKDIKDITTLVFNTALLINERAKLPICFLFFTRPCCLLISVEDQKEDLTVILQSKFTCVTFRQF